MGKRKVYTMVDDHFLGLSLAFPCQWRTVISHRERFQDNDDGSMTSRYDGCVKLTIDIDREEDGRWIAEALELPGVMCYSQTSDQAISNAERLAIEVIADRIAHGELPSSALGVAFTISDDHLARQ
jgi:predicted RNase H-like HicB family nuclease